MPTYTFHCAACERTWDEIIPWEELKARPSPFECSCGAKEARHVFRVPNVVGDECRGIGTLDTQYEGDQAEIGRIVAGARKAGYNPSPNDHYDPTMAKFKGDPRAFFSYTDGRSARKRLAAQYHSGPPRPKTRLAEKTVRRLARKYVQQNPALARDKRALREMILERHAPKGS